MRIRKCALKGGSVTTSGSYWGYCRRLAFKPSCHFYSLHFDSAFFPDCTKLYNIFVGYWIGNLIRISKMCSKRFCGHYKWMLQAILTQTVIKTVFLALESLTALFYQTVPTILLLFCYLR